MAVRVKARQLRVAVLVQRRGGDEEPVAAIVVLLRLHGAGLSEDCLDGDRVDAVGADDDVCWDYLAGGEAYGWGLGILEKITLG